jgi:lipoprotein-anchoring transpeptidase ErfK/SrfK
MRNKKLFFWIFLISQLVFTEKETSGKTLPLTQTSVERIVIKVTNCQIITTQKQSDSLFNKIYKAATASPRNIGCIPWGIEGVIWKIVLNPSWTPTKNMRLESLAKGKTLPETILPGRKDNPLGIGKLFILYASNSTLGIHNTNNEKSVGLRVTHGCNRLAKEDFLEIAALLLKQNGFNADSLFAEAEKNPQKSIAILLKKRPTVVYEK